MLLPALFGFTTLLFSAQEAVPAPPPADAAKGTAAAGPAGLEIPWLTSLPEAVEKARKTPGTRLLVEFVEKSCGECARMQSLVHPSTSFFAFMRDKVAVRVSRDTPEGKALADRMGIRRSPGWAVVTPDLLLCGYQDGPTSQSEWFATFARSEAAWREYEQLLEKERKDPGDAGVVFRVAAETFERRGDDVSEPRFRRLSKDPKAPAEMREQSLAYLASIELEQGRAAEAEGDLETLLRTAKDPMLKERAELHLVDVEIARGRKDKAVARLRTFLTQHPESKLVDQARAVLKALKPDEGEGIAR